MDSQDQRRRFFVTLPASASSQEFPNNTNSKFRVRLPQKLHLSLNNWEVSLSNIHFPNKFHNITKGEIKVKHSIDGEIYTKKVSLGRGWIRNPGSIIRLLNEKMKRESVSNTNLGELVELHFNQLSSFTSMTISDQVTSVEFSEDLQELLGVEKMYYPGNHHATRTVDVMRGLAFMYVYCSVVAPEIIGDTMAQLLRIVPVGVGYAHASKEFKTDHMVPVNGTDIEVIEVNIRKDNGETVTFVDGKVVVTLCFQKREQVHP